MSNIITKKDVDITVFRLNPRLVDVKIEYGGYSLKEKGCGCVRCTDLLINELISGLNAMLNINKIEERKIKLERETGHVLLEPGNQYCKYCGDAMFVKELSSKKCRRRGIMNDYKVLEKVYVEKIRIECNPRIDVKDITSELKLRGYKIKKVDFVEVSKNTKVYFINAEKNVKIKKTIKKGVNKNEQ